MIRRPKAHGTDPPGGRPFALEDQGVLREYLEAHEKEVVNSMIMLFEQEESVRRYGKRMRSEGRAEGHAEGRAEGRDEGRIAAYAELVAEGSLTAEKAAQKLNMTVEEFRKAAEALKTTA